MSDMLFHAISVAILMTGAIWNGYPIVYSDTSSYLASGFELETLVDRPITYGVFSRITSFNGTTLWTVIMAQCLLLSIILRRTLDLLEIRSDVRKLLIILVTSMATGITFVSGQLIPDIFTPILLLSCFLLIADPEPVKLLMLAIYIVAFSMHMSHIPIMLLVLLIVAIHFLFFNKRKLRTRLLPITIVSLIGIIPMGVSISKSSHVFFMARMAENGILQEFLKENCDKDRYRLCQAGNIPRDANAFMWDPQGPMQLFATWADSKDEFERIISTSFKVPKYQLMHAEALIRSTVRQLASSQIADGTGVFGPGTLMYQRLAKFVPEELDRYENSRQSRSLLQPATLSALIRMHDVVLLLSVAYLLIFLVIRLIRKRVTGINTMAVIFVAAIILINAICTGGMVVVAPRFGTRVIWLLPLMALIMILQQENVRAIKNSIRIRPKTRVAKGPLSSHREKITTLLRFSPLISTLLLLVFSVPAQTESFLACEKSWLRKWHETRRDPHRSIASSTTNFACASC